MDPGAQSPGSFSMDNADAGKMGKSGIVQVFVQGGHGLVHCLAQQVDRSGFVRIVYPDRCPPVEKGCVCRTSGLYGRFFGMPGPDGERVSGRSGLDGGVSGQ